MDEHQDDVVEFALLLTRLKKRADRSYAVLARSLGLTASTLHRYCTGEAVPPDFTGIGRFAALCGATPGERAELHRRWVLATAARQRSRPSGARRAPASGGDPRSAAAEASSSRSGQADEAREPGGSPVPPARPPSASRPEPSSPSIPCPDAASPSVPRSEAASPGDPGPRPGRRRRQPGRAMALVLSLAVALGCLTASAAAPASDGAEPSASARVALPEHSAAVTRSGGDPREESGGSRPEGRAIVDQVPPSPSARLAAPKPSAPVTHGADGGQGKGQSAGAAALSPPLTWTADSHIWGELACDHDYVIAKPPQRVPPPPHPADAGPWAASQGAVHGRDTNVRITVQGRGSEAVVLEALRVRVVERTVPSGRPGAAAYSMADGCGATLQPRYFSVDLDAHRPLPRAMPAGRPDSPSFAVDFPYRVSLRQPEVLLVVADAESCTCDWYLELDWSSRGRSGTVRIDDHGRPFRTTTVEGLPHYTYRRPGGWVPMPTADGDAGTDG